MRFAAHIPASTAVAVAHAALLAAAACFAVTALAQPSPFSAAADAPAAAKRPKAGLVLSGGGARGITHIGVLKVMEEMRIPVDYLAATSMGSIVGGLYASGMSPAKMQEVVTSVNWSTLFSDSPPRRELGFRDKQVDTRFPLPIEIGFRDGEIRGFQGALSGANLGLFLHQLTSRADGIGDFDRLPIPFRAISTDMVTGKPYIFDEGPLYEAMRASMSIPGVFSPSEVRGRIRGDGELAGSYLGFGRIVYYHRLATVPYIGGSVFAGGSLEAGNAWQRRDAVSANDLAGAGSLFLAADTFLGPFYFAYGRATGGASIFYLVLGRP